jgi:DNA-binding MarR family transcriptional regulator
MRQRAPKNWYLVSSHGSVIFYIALHPDCTIDDIAESHSLTQRTVWGIIGDLRRAGMLVVRREGRRHHYTVDPTGPFLHPAIGGIQLSVVLGRLVARGRETLTTAV